MYEASCLSGSLLVDASILNCREYPTELLAKRQPTLDTLGRDGHMAEADDCREKSFDPGKPRRRLRGGVCSQNGKD
jgi:hypothetical protein